jgi:DeoR/GlpR family transcriptional regulator of sugar metabolism
MFRATQPNINLAQPAEANEGSICEEKHYSVTELAALWNLSKQTIRRLFQDETGVVRIGEREVRRHRGYVTLRIPESVARKVHQRLCKSA